MQQTENSIAPQAGFLAGLNGPQLQAATHGEGPALVLAGPGSGKTTVIVKRILYLIREKHIPPEDILVVTFTKDAALSMQQRFLREAERSEPVNFGTFHSIFYHILLQSHYFSSKINLLTKAQEKTILFAILREKTAARQEYFDSDALKELADSFLCAIGFYKNTRDEAAAAKRLPESWRSGFREVFEAYMRRCREQGGIDFDDMVYECRSFLLADDIQRKYWQNRFRFILIDEFQDINPLQYEVVRILGDLHKNLFAVGDDDQAIYGFRGSSPACLRQFAGELNARQIILNANYRSTGEIVMAAERVIRENKNRFAKSCYAVTEGGRGGNSDKAFRVGDQSGRADDVCVYRFGDRAQELNYLTRELGEFVRSRPGETCGVLFRTNGSMQSLAALLSREGIHCQIKEQSGSLYDHFIAKDIMAYLRLAAGDGDRKDLLRIMNRPVRYICRESLGECPVVDLRELENWYRRRGRLGDGQIAEAVCRLERQLDRMGSMRPGLAILYICRSMGYEEYLRSRREAGERLEEWLDLLESLREEAGHYEDVRQWERAQKAEREKHFSRERREERKENCAIRLMTVHASKGLEFDRVYMPDCNEKVYPHGSLPDREQVEEERRIFYVGMTRAKKHLELLCTAGTKERPRVMSRFLNPLTKAPSSVRQKDLSVVQ